MLLVKEYVQHVEMASLLLCKDTGEIFYHSAFSDIDDMEEVGDFDRDECIGIPHKMELGLGRGLIFEFVEESLPDDYERVRKIFRRKAGMENAGSGAVPPGCAVDTPDAVRAGHFIIAGNQRKMPGNTAQMISPTNMMHI